MRAQRARCRKAVESYEGERPMMDFPIGANELSCHEPHVGMERIRSADVGRGVCTRSGQVEIRLTDQAIEVEDRRRVAAIRMNAGGISRASRAVGVPREEKVGVCAGEEVGNWVGRAGARLALSRFGPCRSP